MIGGSGAIGFFVWRTLVRLPSTRERARRFLLSSAFGISCNVLLIWSSFLISWIFPGNHPPSLATPNEHAAAVWLYRISVAGLLVSVLSAILASRSERCVPRELCLWGSCAAIFFWFASYIALGEILAIYSVYHA